MKYHCPFCGEIMDEEEAEGCCDCGCPSCRRYIDWEDWPDQIEDEEEISLFDLPKDDYN